MIIRSTRAEKFTVIDNKVIEDDLLDWAELGLLTYLLSKPDYWEVSTAQLISIRKSGKHAVRAFLQKLRQAGYADRKPNPKGGWDWVIYDSPNTENRNSDNRCSDNQDAENRNSDNPPQVKTIKAVNTDKAVNALFDQFWESYPRKRSKDVARKAFKARKPDEQLLAILLDAIQRAKKSAAWLKSDGEFIPYPASWLEAAGWEDVHEPAKPAKITKHTIEKRAKAVGIEARRGESHEAFAGRILEAELLRDRKAS